MLCYAIYESSWFILKCLPQSILEKMYNGCIHIKFQNILLYEKKKGKISPLTFARNTYVLRNIYNFHSLVNNRNKGLSSQ